MSDWLALLLGLLQGIGASVVLLLAVFIGVCVLIGAWKLRHGTRPNAARSLDELVGQRELARYLPPDTPRGPIDQLGGSGTSSPARP